MPPYLAYSPPYLAYSQILGIPPPCLAYSAPNLLPHFFGLTALPGIEESQLTLPSSKLSTFFPKIMSGRAKVGYVRYYVDVFSWILPQIAEMPSSLHPPPPPFCQASGQMSCPSFFMMIFVPLPLAEFSRVNYCDRHISPNCRIRAWRVVLLLLARTNSARN